MRNPYYKSHTKAVSLAALCLFLLCALALSVHVVCGRADTVTPAQITTRIVKHASDCTYYYLDNPTAVYASDNGDLTVADGNSALTFDTADWTAAPQKSEIIPNTEKLAEYGVNRITLADGILRVNDTELGNCIDFTRLDALLFAIDGTDPTRIWTYDLRGHIEQVDVDEETPDPETPPETEETPDEQDVPKKTDVSVPTPAGCAFKKIAADKKGVYFVTQSEKSKSWNTVYYATYENDALTVTASFTVRSEILRLESCGNGRVICLTRGLLTAYTLTGKSFAKTGEFSCPDAVTISVTADTVYGISDDNSVFMLRADLSARRELLASAHGAKGFFRANAGIASRKQMIAVADELNNRVQIVTESDTKILNGTFVEPKAVALDSAGNIYVAHTANKIAVYNAALTDTGTEYVAVSENADFAIIDMLFDSDDKLFVLGDNGRLYKGTQFEAVNENDFVAMAIAPKDNTLYAVTADNAMVKYTDAGQWESVALPAMPRTMSFCLDHDDSFYLLTDDGCVVKYGKETGKYARVTALPTAYEQGSGVIHAVKIIMNTAAYGADRDIPLSYGDLLLSDTGAHAVKSIAGKQLDVNKNFPISTQVPPVPNENEPSAVRDGEIIFEITDCEVYAQAAEINRLTSLRDGMRVIIPDFDANAPYTLIIADNLQNSIEQPPVTGYVRTSCIKNKKPLPYGEPPVGACYSYSTTGASIYKYPTLNAKPIETLPKDTRLTLLPFICINEAYGYADNRTVPTIWYRVSYKKGENTYEGFVIGDSISIRGENPDDRNIYPRHNATVITEASLYEKDADGNIVVVSDAPFLPLKANTKVEVVGAYDSSQEYTLIRYYHDGIGTLQFYVETANLKYDGVNRVHVVAIVLIILTVLLGVGLLIRYFHVKRTRKYHETKI